MTIRNESNWVFLVDVFVINIICCWLIQHFVSGYFGSEITTRQKDDFDDAKFYDSIKNMLSAPTLIVDLRNNEGGAKKEAWKYFSLLKNIPKRVACIFR